eukprot:CCRYP_003359-RC/>CCRYP_003359-RC protein AED:0.02 eAED:0.02 QI:257/1/1/1/0.75/0.6/5/685/1333
MSNAACWIPMNSWIALAAHHEKTRIRETMECRDSYETLPAEFSVDGRTVQAAVKLAIELACIKQCVNVSLLFLRRLTQDDNWEEDADVSVKTSDIDGNCLRIEDISMPNIAVEIQLPVGHDSRGQDVADIDVSRDGCTIDGVQLDTNQLKAVVYSPSNIEFRPPIKGNPLARSQFTKSRHQFLRQLGFLFFQIFSRGGTFPNPNINPGRMSTAAENCECKLSRFSCEDQINEASKIIRRMNLDVYKEVLLDASVPDSICRVVTDLIHSGGSGEETSFSSLIDVINELQDIVYDRPHTLFYKPDTLAVDNIAKEGKIDFGNVVYGREIEINRILELAALHNDPLRTRLILIGGNGGEGKTFMIEGVRNHLVNSCGWFHVGVKFDRLMHNSPLSVIASAFESFFVSLFSSGDNEPYLAAIAISLPLFLSPSMIVLLCNLIPSLRELFPVIMQRVVSDDDLTAHYKESDATEQNQFDEILSDSESSRNRLHYSISRLVHAISSLGIPLLLVFDDLQWAGQDSLDLITSMMVEWSPVQFAEVAPIAQVLFVGLYRSDDVDDDHILTTKYFPAFNLVAAMDVHSILLGAITKNACNSMIAYALRLPRRLTRSLAAIVHAKTSGNVFYMKVFLEALVINKTLHYSLTERRWVWRLDTVHATPITENVAQLMRRNLQILPETTLWALKLLSCLGSKACESVFMLLEDHIDMINELAVAIEKNIVEKQGQVYRFTHDILEQSVYDMMSRHEKNNNHLFLGLELINKANETGSQFRQAMIIAIDQINRAKMLGNTQLSYSCQYANLNLKAAESSMSISDFSSALSYAEHGISFLDGHLWDDYKLTLQLYDMACKASFKSYQGGKMPRFVDEIFKHANCLQDKFSSHLLLIESLGVMGKEGQAIDSAFSLLQELGDTSPEDISSQVISNEIVETKSALLSYTDDDIKNAPRVTDWNVIARMRVLGPLMPFLFTERPQYIPYVGSRIINLSIQHGFCSDSSFGLVAYATLLLESDIDQAYRWGKLSVSLLETFESTDKLPRLKCAFYSFLAFFREPLQAVVDLLKCNYRDALMAGDAYYACVSISYHTRFRTMCGHYLPDLEQECKTFATQMVHLTDPIACLTYLGISEAIYKLSGSPVIPFSLMPCLNIQNEEDYMQRLEAAGMSSTLQAGYFNALFVSFWHTKYDEAAGWAKKYKCRNQNRFLDVYHSFYEGLSGFQLARKCSNYITAIEAGKRAIASFEKWMKHSTWNFENKFSLLLAELQFFMGNKECAIEKYQAAIKAAHDRHFVHEEGLAFELLGSLYTHYGDMDQAKVQRAKAHKCYEKWGAFGIIELRVPTNPCLT